jgi:hypothetical protein
MVISRAHQLYYLATGRRENSWHCPLPAKARVMYAGFDRSYMFLLTFNGWVCHWLLVAAVVWKVFSIDFLLVVIVDQLPSGVSTSSVIPLQGFLPLDGVGWWYVELGCARGIAINFKGGRRLRWILAYVPFDIFSPLFALLGLRWRAAAGRRSYERRRKVQWPW